MHLIGASRVSDRDASGIAVGDYGVWWQLRRQARPVETSTAKWLRNGWGASTELYLATKRGRLVNHTLAVTRRAGYRGVDRKPGSTCVHVFDRARLDPMLSPEAIEGYRRSAAMAPLAPAAVAEIIETAAELARRQREIAKALHVLHSRWPAVRGALNELSKLTGYD